MTAYIVVDFDDPMDPTMSLDANGVRVLEQVERAVFWEYIYSHIQKEDTVLLWDHVYDGKSFRMEGYQYGFYPKLVSPDGKIYAVFGYAPRKNPTSQANYDVQVDGERVLYNVSMGEACYYLIDHVRMIDGVIFGHDFITGAEFLHKYHKPISSRRNKEKKRGSLSFSQTS